jgi:predicted secreted protein
MTTGAKIGYGTLLAYGDGATPDAFTTMAEVTNLGGPGFSADSIDATHMASPNGWREFIAGLLDGGEVSADCNYLPGDSSHGPASGALYIFKSRLTRNWRITFPTSPAVLWILPAIVTGFELDIPVDDKMGLSLTLKVAGEPTLA